MHLNKKGFTLVETLGVIVILGVIALIAIPALSASFGDVDQRYYSNLTRLVELAGRDYYMDHHTLTPISEGDKGKVDLSNLVNLKYIDQPQSTSKKNCIGYVEVTKGDKLDYLTCLKCDNYESDSSCDFSSSQEEGNGSGIGSRKDGYLTIDKTYYEVIQGEPFIAPFASYYYDGELVRSDIGSTPSYIDTNVLTTYTLTYYYLNAEPISIEVKVLDVTSPNMINVVLRENSLSGTIYNGGWTKNDVYQIFNATDGPMGSGVKGYEYSFSNQPNNSNLWTYTTSDSITQKDLLAKLNNGSHDFNQKVYVRAVDNFGNKSTAIDYTVSVDQTNPSCVSSGGDSTWINTSRTLLGTCSDSGSGCAANVTRVINTDIDSTKESPGVVRDKVGNETTCPANQTVRIDTTVPVVHLTVSSQDTRYHTNIANLSVNATDAVPGVTRMCIQTSPNVNNCNWIAYSNISRALSTGRDYDGGSTTFYAFVEDQAGNIGSYNSSYNVYKYCSQTTTSWGGWSSCDRDCDGGTQYQSGTKYDSFFASSCGSTSRSSSCNTHACESSGGGGGTHCCFGGRTAGDGGYACWEAPASYDVYKNCYGDCADDNWSWPSC